MFKLKKHIFKALAEEYDEHLDFAKAPVMKSPTSSFGGHSKNH